MFTRDIIYEGKTYNFHEVKHFLETRSYRDIHTLSLLITDKVFVIINNSIIVPYKLI